MLLFNGLFWLLILAHTVGEFYLQPAKLYAKRRACVKMRLAHTVAYCAVVWLCLTPILFARGPRMAYVYILLAVGGTHALVVWGGDWLAARYKDRLGWRGEQLLYWAGQALQLAVIFVTTLVFRTQVGRTLLSDFGDALHSFMVFYVFSPYQPVRLLNILQVACMLLLVGKPANAAIGTVLSFTDESAPRLTTMERVQGTVERALVVLLMLSGQFIGIPLVFLVKGVFSHMAVAGDRKMAERLLLITFLSALVAVAVVIFCGPAPNLEAMTNLDDLRLQLEQLRDPANG